MKRKLMLLGGLLLTSLLGANAQGTWTAPAAPGQDLSTLAEDVNVFVYNIEADAILSRGMDWGTKAVTARLDYGDSRSDVHNCQKARILKEGDYRLIHLLDRETNRNLGQDDNDNAGAMWSDMWTDTGNRSRFSFAASPNYPNAYVLTNVAKNKPVDVLWSRGGKLTLFDGKGYTDWTFITETDIAAGKLPQFKARKAIWGIYQALVKANAVEANAAALEAANSVYNNAEATTDQLRAAFRTLFLAVAGSIEDPVDVSYMFTHADIFGDQSGEGWGYNDFPKGVTECEKYHAAFTLEQALTDAPNGLYDVTFVGIYRQDGAAAAAPVLTVTASAGGTGNLANMENLGAQWAVGGGDQSGDNRSEAGWAISSTGKRPNWMFSAGPAQALDDACAKVENVKVKDGGLKVNFTVANDQQWVNFQRFIITYKGSINAGLYKSLVEKIAEAEAYANNAIPASYVDAVKAVANDAKSLTANSEEEDLTAAVNAIDNAISAANAAPLNTNLGFLNATITLASAEGVDVTAAQAAYDTSASTTNDAIVNVLNALRIARRVAHAETHADVFAGHEPAAGDFYLYNVGTGRFLCGGADWGAHAALGFPGIIVTLEDAGDGNFKLNTHLTNGKDGDNNKEYLNYGGYCDTWTTESWKFVSQDGGKYNIVRSNDAAQLLGYEGGTYNNVITNCATASSGTNQWKLVTKADRDALLAAATAENPADASYLIQSPGFSQREDVSAWVLDGGASIWERGVNHPDFAVEAFNQATASVQQTVTGLPKGTYQLQVQAFYRDGNFAKQEEILAGGGEARQLATLFAGTKSALIQNVSVGADKAPGMGRSSSVGFMPDGINDACLYFQSGLYWATLNNIVVGKDGTMTIGASKTEKMNDGDWLVLDNFRLKYLGSYIDLTEVKADLKAKIDEANAVMDKAIIVAFLSNAVASAQTIYSESTDLDEIVDATANLTTLINTFNNSSSALDVFLQTEAKVIADGIDASAEKAAVQNVADGSAYATAISTQLNSLRTARRLKAVDKQEDVFTGSAPENNGQYYIYNVGAKRYLTGGVDYGTHAAVNYAAQIATFTQNGDGWRIHTNIRTGSDALNHNGFVDCGGDGDTWYLIEVTPGVYNISNTNSNTGATLLGYSGERRGNWWQVDTDNQGADQAINQWKLVSKDERDALMATATEENPVDATYYIHAAGFDHHLADASLAFPTQKWQEWFPEGKGGNHGIGGWEPDYNWECWNAGNFKLYQELTNLPAGRYMLSAQGYYRHGGFEQARDEEVAGNTKADGAVLYATNGSDVTYQSYLAPLVSEAGNLPGYGRDTNFGAFPDDRNETAAQFFEAGLYKNHVSDIIVGADGKLTIGIEKFENNQGNEWVVMDNFRLTYLGPVEIKSMTIVGDFTEIGWEPANGLTMTQDAENPAIWTATKDVTVEGKTYEYKVTANGVWGEYELPASGNQNWGFGTDMYPAGDYRLVFTADTENHTLTLAVYGRQSLTLDENATEQIDAYEYADVTVNRAFNEGWNAVVLPFDTEAFNDAKIVELDNETVDGEGNVTLKFKKAESIKANVPYLVNFPAAVPSDKVFYGVNVAPAEAKVEGEYFDFVGTHVKATVVSEGDYVISGGKLSKATTDIELKGGRTFFKAKTQAGVRSVTLSFDDDVTTGISVISNATVQKSIYNLQGQKVNKASKGIFIENGKKVIK